MKILFVIPYVPNRIRVRSYQLLTSLTSRGHDVFLVAPWTTDEEFRQLEALRGQCAGVETVHLTPSRSLLNCVIAVTSPSPLQAAYSWHAGLARRAAAIARNVDVVHVEHIRGSAYALWIRRSIAGSQVPIVWDGVDCISSLFRQTAKSSDSVRSRWIAQLELRRTESYEARLAGTFERTLVSSALDQHALLTLPRNGFSEPRVSVLPNGVDLEYFRPDSRVVREPATIVITGKMSYHANVSMVVNFVRNSLPAIRRARPNVSVWLVGKDPSPKVRALAAEPGVHVTGTVPDIRPYLSQATLAVAPLTYGVGIQNKVLEAMACGTPVVATAQAASALRVVDGCQLVIAREPEDMSEAVLDLLGDPHKRQALSLEGRRFVESQHDWNMIASRLENIYHEVIPIRR
jgi:sugar transferase (PEP-CTERM/EpsH1 system associated)